MCNIDSFQCVFYIMNEMKAILFIIASIFAGIFFGCINDDFTTSPNATLTFSKDTVSFGTLFTDLDSPTARLVVRNPNKKGVTISSIRFRDPDTPFRLNVDGQSGSVFNDIEIRGNDSIFVFIECRIDVDDTLEPFRISDQLDFITNGVEQEVEVEAWAWNVTRIRGESISSDMTLTSERPYIIFDTLRIEEGVTLSIDPGAMILFHDKAGIVVDGTITAVGGPGRMIQMRGDRLDDVLPDVSYDVLAGQWGGITITGKSFNNRIEYVDMRSTTDGLRIDSCGDLSKQKLTLVNSWLHNSRSTVLESSYAKVDAYGCCFSEAAEAVVRLTGGEHVFSQCTIANYYLFSAWGEPNLSLYHCMPDEAEENSLPLMKASFENGIIWGDIGSPIYPGDLLGSDVFLKDMLLKADGTDDDNFINCVWNEDPLFFTVRNEYYFNYHLKEGSPAIGRGNPAYVVSETLDDMDGYYRLADGNPDLGAYVYRPEESEE